MSEESRNWTRYTRRGALGLMSVGTVGIASETLGFTNLTAGRGINIGVVTDDYQSAILRITDNSGGNSIGEEQFDDSVQVDIENNTGTKLDAADNDLTVTIDPTDVNSESLDVSQPSSSFSISGSSLSSTEDSATLDLNTDTVDGNTVSFILETNNNGGSVKVDITFDVTYNGASFEATREVTVNDTSSTPTQHQMANIAELSIDADILD